MDGHDQAWFEHAADVDGLRRIEREERASKADRPREADPAAVDDRHVDGTLASNAFKRSRESRKENGVAGDPHARTAVDVEEEADHLVDAGCPERTVTGRGGR